MKTFKKWLEDRITGLYPLGYGGLGLYHRSALEPGNPYVDASLKLAKKKKKRKKKKKS